MMDCYTVLKQSQLQVNASAKVQVHIGTYMHIYTEFNTHLRPSSIMLKNLPKILLGISQKFSLLCFLLCLIMLTVITAVSYVYTHN